MARIFNPDFFAIRQNMLFRLVDLMLRMSGILHGYILTIGQSMFLGMVEIVVGMSRIVFINLLSIRQCTLFRHVLIMLRMSGIFHINNFSVRQSMFLWMKDTVEGMFRVVSIRFLFLRLVLFLRTMKRVFWMSEVVNTDLFTIG